MLQYCQLYWLAWVAFLDLHRPYILLFILLSKLQIIKRRYSKTKNKTSKIEPKITRSWFIWTTNELEILTKSNNADTYHYQRNKFHQKIHPLKWKTQQ